VGLAGAGFHLVMRQPLLLDVAAEPLPGAAGVGASPVSLAVFGALPGAGRLLPGWERSGGAAAAFHVVECLVADNTVGAFSLPDRPDERNPDPSRPLRGPILSLICHPNWRSGGGIG
jgi:hypothetical protein